jgi:hypothetical protein
MHKTTDEEVDKELPQNLTRYYAQVHGPFRSATMNETESITGRAPFYLPHRPCLRGLGEEQVSTSSRALARRKMISPAAMLHICDSNLGKQFAGTTGVR